MIRRSSVLVDCSRTMFHVHSRKS